MWILERCYQNQEVDVITITVAEFVKQCPRSSRDWIINKCVPIKTSLAVQGILNVYDAERVLAVARKHLDETQMNHNLAGSKKAGAIKNLEHIISNMTRYIDFQKNSMAA